MLAYRDVLRPRILAVKNVETDVFFLAPKTGKGYYQGGVSKALAQFLMGYGYRLGMRL
jgi:hypothetical protein